MALRLCCIFLLVACCGVSKAADDDEVEVCRGHCRTIAFVLIPDTYDNTTDTEEASERKHGNNRAVSPHAASNRDLLALDIHTFCTVLCQRMQEDEAIMELCADQDYSDGSEEDGEEETDSEDRLRRKKALTNKARRAAAGRRGRHGRRASAARRRHTH